MMQQAIPNRQSRRARARLDSCKRHLGLFGALAGELVALASMATALTTGLLLLTTLVAL